jgi:hypothetical protein
LVLAWLPREDGVFLTDAPQRLVQQGKVANVPFVTGKHQNILFSSVLDSLKAIATMRELFSRFQP